MSVTFRIHNADVAVPVRTCATVLTSDEEDTLVEEGVIVPHQRLNTEGIDELRDAVDRFAAVRFPSADEKTYHEEFVGQYIRDPHKQDPRILTVPLQDFPLADTVRCLLGPRIVLRNSNIRITRPGTNDSTVWHTDYRPHTSPPPRLGSAPSVVTVLVYLDSADRETGPLFVVPGSHRRPGQPDASTDARPDEIALEIQPGQVVMMNAALWHRGGSNVSPDRVRRLITLQLSTVFMTPFNFETTLPSAGYQRLLEQARASKDEPLLELVGLGGVNPTSARY